MNDILLSITRLHNVWDAWDALNTIFDSFAIMLEIDQEYITIAISWVVNTISHY